MAGSAEKIGKILKEQAECLEALGIKPGPLKRKYTIGGSWPKTRQHTCNHGGGFGRAARRLKGWGKHSKGPGNVPYYAPVPKTGPNALQ